MQGSYVKCKCGEQHILEGPGYGYPHFYQEAMAKIKDGKYGKEMKGETFLKEVIEKKIP